MTSIAKCGSRASPHLIYTINGYGTCQVCGAHFKDNTEVNEPQEQSLTDSTNDKEN